MGALDGGRGLLLGEKRHRQVDVLAVEASAGGAEGLEALLSTRLDASSVAGWRVVGVALADGDIEAAGDLLLDELVPGDLVVTGPGDGRVFVHRGDGLVRAPAFRRARAPASRRPRRGSG